MSAAAFAAYRGLVYDTKGFRTFFRAMTPLAEIAQLKFGSRPASRTKSDRIEDLRAIPWVFSWAQARVMLPGWYGAGDGLAAANDLSLLKEMYEGWRFFRATLDNLEMVLAKSDMAIAERYAELAGPQGAPIFARVKDGWQRTHDLVLAASSDSSLSRASASSGSTSTTRLIDPQLQAQRRERSLRSLYWCSDDVPGRDPPVTYLSHMASFHSNDRIAPSNHGIKHLANRA